MQPAGSFTGCLRATSLNKTPGELGAASSTHRRPYGFLKLSRRPRNRKGAGRAPYGNGQNIHFYSPYGAREWFVKAPLPARAPNGNIESIISHRNMKPQRFCEQSWSSFLAERKMRILLFVKNVICDESCLAIPVLMNFIFWHHNFWWAHVTWIWINKRTEKDGTQRLEFLRQAAGFENRTGPGGFFKAFISPALF